VAEPDPGDQLAETIRVEGTAVLATLTRTFGNMQLAQDAVQEAAIAALKAWPQAGVPADPRAWLLVTARNKAYDILRRESARPAKESAASYADAGIMPDTAEEAIAMLEPASAIRDDMLRLIFTCCHPALAPEARVALALRTLAGLDVQAVARAFGVPEQTMAKRLVRARQKIVTARIPYRVPDDAELPGRLPAVLSVVSVIATEAHSPSSGDAVTRIDYEQEAIRLARLLAELMPGEPEILGLLALLLFTAARRPARTSPPRTGAAAAAAWPAGGASEDGTGLDEGGDEPVLLRDQDRSAWDRAMIAEAGALLAEALRRSAGVAGPYQLQAHLSACHSTAPSWAETDWNKIVALYDLIAGMAANPAVMLNRAIALGERDGPAVMLSELDAIAGLERSHLWHAARADALARLGRPEEAVAALRTAVALAPTTPERRLLTARLNAAEHSL
jgi:RNA polymerase sigma-70 factor, ECF subfamily